MFRIGKWQWEHGVTNGKLRATVGIGEVERAEEHTFGDNALSLHRHEVN